MSNAPEQFVVALADRYRIERELGAGGMATVYLAHDVRHDRKVALKVLRPELSAILGGERFLAEIKTTANLQHPHILGLFDSGEAEGLVFYVMPYVEGESLRDRLNREKQLPVEEAVRIAREVADALDYAHQHGVVHRDIKPENILLHGGHAMVADFGIALAASRSEGGSRMTETGMSLGTPHYMSPEQAMGEREISPKADIYALGCVLYEMLTAEPPFVGATAQAIIARVLTEEPRSLTVQRRTIPGNVEAAVRRALEKLPADRFASAAEFGAALASSDFGLQSTRSSAGAQAGLRTERGWRGMVRRGARLLPWLVAAGAALLYTMERLRPDAPPPPVGRFAIRLQPEVVGLVVGQVIAVSPDGSRMVFVGSGVGGNQLFTRTMDQSVSVAIPGTEGAESPFFSADGRHIGYVVGSRMFKVAVAGGPTLSLTDVGAGFRGGAWNARDTILFADGAGLHLVPASGGASTLLATPDSGKRETFRWPTFLPGGRDALFSISAEGVDRLAAITVASREIRRFDVLGSDPHYVARGYVTLALIGTNVSALGSGTLMAVPFDARRLEVRGPPTPISDSVQVGTTSRTGKLGVSDNGTIVFASGGLLLADIVAVSRGGASRTLSAAPRNFFAPSLSPDGKSLAVQIFENGSDIWVFGVASKALSRLTFDQSGLRPLWTVDGRRVVYDRQGDGRRELAWIPADGSGPAESLLAGENDQMMGAFTPDGRTMVFGEQLPSGRRQVSAVTFDSVSRVRPIIANAFENHTPSLSPDGKWVAYVSNESGRSEVYVRPFPGPGGRWQISRDGGTEPLWSGTGREIFYRAGDRMMAAEVQVGANFAPGASRELFRTTAAPGITFRNYDVSRDGQTLYFAQPVGDAAENVVVLLNWFEQLPRIGR